MHQEILDNFIANKMIKEVRLGGTVGDLEPKVAFSGFLSSVGWSKLSFLLSADNATKKYLCCGALGFSGSMQ